MVAARAVRRVFALALLAATARARMGSPCMKNTPACKLKAELSLVANSAKAAEFARREGSAAFEATRAATVERVIAGREASLEERLFPDFGRSTLA